MTLEGIRFAVLVEEQYEDQELWYPLLRLTEAGAQVTLVGPQAGVTYQSKHGYPAESEAAASDVSADDFDGVVIPGGYAPDRMRRDEAMVSLVREAFAAGKVVAAICHAGWMLCSAGVLEGKRVTSVSAIKDDMTNAGANWTDEEVVQDDNLITSRTPADLPAYLRTIIAVSEA
ncbi:MAG: type 1 glutamine amidotransferase [Planctomycetota bacterium]|nr:MAG: type 1 glutamine amidotransferase [Planctomycetota bacterium]